MVRALIVAPLAALLLAGCGPGEQAAGNAAAPAESDYVRQVRAMPQGQRVGVMFRAIRDAGSSCQQVTAVSETEGAGTPTWLATCSDGSHWLISIGRGGTATVAPAPTRR